MKLIYLLLLLPMLAIADSDDDCRRDPHHCDNGGQIGPPGPQGEQGEQGEAGATGATGQAGADGAQGEQGITGTTGGIGAQGERGLPGVVSTTWITETRLWQTNWLHYSAASDAIQIYLPQKQHSRLTFGVARIHGTGGYALGYAYKNEDGVAFTLGLGTSGGEQVGKASVGFEFGSTGRTRAKSCNTKKMVCTYIDGELHQYVEGTENTTDQN
jgi:hypothetical protein